ncbi:CDGP domain-containing protein [Mycobacterium barrassiae]|uniref:CDGP domain-containing protein n=1 Tax=Mycobacterium barrassiae TaxID=319709 RepID=UPI003FD8A1F3
MPFRAGVSALLITAAAVGGGVVAAPVAGAVPGDPLDGCVTALAQQLCDGPIREDGSWKRCLFSNGTLLAPATANCFIVPGADQIPMFPIGQPPYHITG